MAPRSIPFSEANQELSLTRNGAFDASYEAALVHDGDLVFPKNATGADVLRAFGLRKAPSESGLFVVTGDLRVDGVLDLDAKISFSLSLAVLGRIEAKVVRVEREILATDIPGRLRAVVRAGDRLLFGGEAKTAFAWPLSTRG